MASPFRMDRPSPPLTSGAALAFVILLGVLSLFTDMPYEGVRSITGPYLMALPALIAFSVGAQLMAAMLLFLVSRRREA
jgi:Zn-dependent protease with chaperone function